MKTNLPKALKMFLFLIFADFAALMIAISFFLIFKDAMWAAHTFTQLFSFIILVTVIWQCTYMLGFKDSNMVRTGHMTEDIRRGFKIGAIAQIPFAVLFILSVVLNFRYGYYVLANSMYRSFLTVFAGSKNMADIYMRDLGVIRLICIALFLLIVPAVSGGVYIMGYKGIDLPTKIFYKKREK